MNTESGGDVGLALITTSLMTSDDEHKLDFISVC